MGFLEFMKKGSFFLPGVMWPKFRGVGVKGLRGLGFRGLGRRGL